MSMNVADASLFTNLNGLQAINQLGKENSDAALRKVAEQFESMFLNIMLKGMRAGEEALFADNYLNSNEMKFHRDNLDNQLALHMASNGGVGLADVLHRQLSSRYAAEAATDSWQGSAAGRELALDPRRAVDGRNIRPRPEPVIPARFESPQQFVETLLPLAEDIAPSLGVDPRVLVAQAALETGWGQKMIRGDNGSDSHNLFGVKATGNWQGEAVTVSTLEFREGAMQRERASFRAYDSYADSFADYARLLRNNPRYSQALANADDPQAFTHELQQAGYATDPHYASKINRVMQNPVFGNLGNGSVLR